MGKFSRDKGKRGERELAELLKPYFPEAKRGANQSRGGSECPDVVAGTKIWWECKRGKNTRPKDALKQAAGDSDGRIPLAYTRDDYERGMVTMYADDFLQLFGEVLRGMG